MKSPKDLTKFACESLLKAFVHFFLSIFCISTKENISKIMKNAFYFIYKALFVFKIFKFLWFFSPFHIFQIQRVRWTRIITRSRIHLHKLTNVIFGKTRKPLCIKLSKLPRSLKKEFFWTCYATRRKTGNQSKAPFVFHSLGHKKGQGTKEKSS